MLSVFRHYVVTLQAREIPFYQPKKVTDMKHSSFMMNSLGELVVIVTIYHNRANAREIKQIL